MPPDAARPPGARRAAVVANPTKHDVAKLRDAVRAAMGGTRRLMIVTQPGRLLVRVPLADGCERRVQRATPSSHS